MEDYGKRLDEARRRYRVVCERLDVLSEQAFSLEQEIMRCNAMLEKQSGDGKVGM